MVHLVFRHSLEKSKKERSPICHNKRLNCVSEKNVRRQSDTNNSYRSLLVTLRNITKYTIRLTSWKGFFTCLRLQLNMSRNTILVNFA